MTPSADDFQAHATALLLRVADPRVPSAAQGPSLTTAPISTHADAVRLVTQADWDAFHRTITFGREENLKPWFRCVSLLRSLGARTAVRENYYVCLDYRSEFASFYAHIDAPRSSVAVRLHFFAVDVKSDELTALTPEQMDSYLGYVVCREWDLPLVGRTVIRVPGYVQESTAINEPVNFFGQRLFVRGVPFMQQDQRFALCCHIGAWILHYTAFRRGVQERRHIADLVGMTGPIQPLRPKATDGLTENQVAHILDQLGFRASILHIPTVENPFHNLPAIRPIELPASFLRTLKQAGLKGLTRFDPALLDQLDELFTGYLQRLDEESDSSRNENELPLISMNNPRVQAVHEYVDYLVRPYIASGWPIYAGTSTHAFALCGRSEINGAPVYFLHDDQNGPYLLAHSLPTLSRDSLWHQSAMPLNGRSLQKAPSHDAVQDLIERGPTGKNDARRAIEALVFAVPSRVLLSPAAANRKTREALAQMRKNQALLRSLPEFDKRAIKQRLITRVSVLMGIDYKAFRRKQAIDSGDPSAARTFSSLQLAEWVITVEALDSNKTCFAEFVYDASSSDDAPRVQFARALSAVLAISNLEEMRPEIGQIKLTRYGPVRIPEHVGKVQS